MKPRRPYLLRALHEWIVDSGETPYVLVDATVEGVQVPQEYVQEGQIVLNLGLNAVQGLVIEEDFVMCDGRFSGQHFELYLPMAAVRAIYAKDTQQGMVFEDEDFLGGQADSEDDQNPPSDGDKPTLRLI